MMPQPTATPPLYFDCSPTVSYIFIKSTMPNTHLNEPPPPDLFIHHTNPPKLHHFHIPCMKKRIIPPSDKVINANSPNFDTPYTPNSTKARTKAWITLNLYDTIQHQVLHIS
ncbi:hypothetical protein JTE90_003011 [Oedothorax gibbosus]|uniref:Uncharacterized protein n=1 Tax=Oedothorax gibbosus TaxID=931172 RepID=A0AAV6VC27_9ARAC|nr:hypothetical protein JTE90_003011 [Oedothorax gibbosus]